MRKKKTHKKEKNNDSLSMKTGRRASFYLIMQSIHFIYSYMVSDIWKGTIHMAREETSHSHYSYAKTLGRNDGNI